MAKTMQKGNMTMNEFGKIVFCSRHEVEEGVLLRETRTGVVLEEITSNNGTDVVAEFQGVRVQDVTFLEKVLTESRKYLGDKNTPIYVDLNPWNAAINQI